MYNKAFVDLFYNDIKRRWMYINSIIYNTFRDVSSIILEYETIYIPQDIDTQLLYTYVPCCFPYDILRAINIPILDEKISMEQLIIGLNSIPEIGIRLYTDYTIVEINYSFMIILDKYRLNKFGYDKFSIVPITHTIASTGIIQSEQNLNNVFLAYNYFNEIPNHILYRVTINAIYDNFVKPDVLKIINMSFPEELKIMGTDLNIGLITDREFVIAKNIYASDSYRGLCKYKIIHEIAKHNIPRSIIKYYEYLKRRKGVNFTRYIIYHNVSHFIIQML